MIASSIVIIGGDKRLLYTAKEFAQHGFKVYLAGFEKLESLCDFTITDIKSGLEKSDVAVFPVTGIQGDTVPAPFSNTKLKLSIDILDILRKKIVFSGRSQTLKSICKDIHVYDYLEREQFSAANALPTAEGALQVAMEHYVGVLNSSRCLVIGYGRIGKILSRLLKALNANVTVSARKEEHFAYICADGNNFISTQQIKELKSYDIVFNTVPSLIIDESVLCNTEPDTLIIDLASLPGGVDFEAAQRLNIKVVHALSLPGRCSPKTSGEIITRTILNMLKEEDRWQRQI